MSKRNRPANNRRAKQTTSAQRGRQALLLLVAVIGIIVSLFVVMSVLQNPASVEEAFDTVAPTSTVDPNVTPTVVPTPLPYPPSCDGKAGDQLILCKVARENYDNIQYSQPLIARANLRLYQAHIGVIPPDEGCPATDITMNFKVVRDHNFVMSNKVVGLSRDSNRVHLKYDFNISREIWGEATRQDRAKIYWHEMEHVLSDCAVVSMALGYLKPTDDDDVLVDRFVRLKEHYDSDVEASIYAGMAALTEQGYPEHVTGTPSERLGGRTLYQVYRGVFSTMNPPKLLLQMPSADELGDSKYNVNAKFGPDGTILFDLHGDPLKDDQKTMDLKAARWKVWKSYLVLWGGLEQGN